MTKIINSYYDKYVRSQMYHSVKDVASLITMSSENQRLTGFPNGSHISKQEGSTPLNSAN